MSSQGNFGSQFGLQAGAYAGLMLNNPDGDTDLANKITNEMNHYDSISPNSSTAEPNQRDMKILINKYYNSTMGKGLGLVIGCVMHEILNFYSEFQESQLDHHQKNLFIKRLGKALDDTNFTEYFKTYSTDCNGKSTSFVTVVINKATEAYDRYHGPSSWSAPYNSLLGRDIAQAVLGLFNINAIKFTAEIKTKNMAKNKLVTDFHKDLEMGYAEQIGITVGGAIESVTILNGGRDGKPQDNKAYDKDVKTKFYDDIAESIKNCYSNKSED